MSNNMKVNEDTFATFNPKAEHSTTESTALECLSSEEKEVDLFVEETFEAQDETEFDDSIELDEDSTNQFDQFEGIEEIDADIDAFSINDEDSYDLLTEEPDSNTFWHDFNNIMCDLEPVTDSIPGDNSNDFDFGRTTNLENMNNTLAYQAIIEISKFGQTVDSQQQKATITKMLEFFIFNKLGQ